MDPKIGDRGRRPERKTRTDLAASTIALALGDRNEQTLFCARDTLGKKPFYYSQSPDRFVFGSEIAALAVVPGMSRKIRPQAVDDFFAYGYVPEPGTIFEGIHKLPAGCTLTLDRSGRPPRISRYWAPPETAQPRAEDEAKNILSQKITEAVA